MAENFFKFKVDLSTERLIGSNERKCLKTDFKDANKIDAAVENDFNLLIDSGLKIPYMILSIKGAEDVDLTEQQKTEFIEGITEIGKNATTWIITGGFNCGVAKLVGEAGKDYRHLIRSKERRFQLIGIGLWDKTKNKESIEEYDRNIGYHVKKISPYLIDNDNKKDATNDTNYLNAYHDLFILCDMESDKYRDKFELKLAEKAKCPLIEIKINGGQQNDESTNKDSTISITRHKDENHLICSYNLHEKSTEEQKLNKVIFDAANDYYDYNKHHLDNFGKIMLCIKYNEFEKLFDLLKKNETNPNGNKYIKSKIIDFYDKTNLRMKKFNLQIKVNSENIYENLIDFVLFRRLFEKKYDLVVKAWEHCSSPLITILLCSWICQRESLFTEDYQFGRRNLLKRKEDEYLEMAIGLLKIAYYHNFKASQYLIIRKIELFQNLNCFEVAKKASFYSFLYLDSCQAYLRNIWVELPFQIHFKRMKKMKQLKKKLLNWKATGDSQNKVTTDDSNNTEKSTLIKDEIEKQLDKIERSQTYFTKDLKDLLNKEIKPNYGFWLEYPSAKYILCIISYLIHLGLYTYYILVEFPPKQNFYIPYIAYAYSFGYIFDILNNVESLIKMKEVEFSSKRSKVASYFRNIWNYLDMLIYTVFIIGYILTFQPSIIFYTRTIFAAYLSFLYLRFLQFLYPFKSVGQQIISFGILLKDVLVIILIYLLVLFSYGTLAQALLFPNTTLDLLLLKDIIYQPYWQLFGELNLEYVEGNKPHTNMNGTKIIPQKNAIVIVGFGVYMLLSNILLMNLLIAMFGISFSGIQQKKREIWAEQFLKIVSEFEHRTMFPPPISCIEIIFRLFRYVLKNCRKKTYPVVQVIIEGDKSTINTAAEVLKEGMAILIIKGSKGAADVICDVIDSADENLKQLLLVKYKDWNIGDKEKKSLKTIRKKEYKNQVHIINMSDFTNNVDLTTLRAAFSQTYPVVQVIIEGDKSTINTAAEVLKEGMAILIIKGSKGAADIICDVINSTDENLEKLLDDLLVKYKDWNIGDKEKESLQTIRKEEYKNKVYVFNSTIDLDVIILRAAFYRKKKNKEDLRKEIDLFERKCMEEYLINYKNQFKCTHLNITMDNEDNEDD